MQQPEDNTLLKKLERIQDLPMLPSAAIKINKLLKDANVSIRELSETIEKDQAIVAKLLRLVNSAFYGFQGKITTVSHAARILGFNTVRNAVVSISIIRSLSMRTVWAGFDMVEFWNHSVSVAVAGRQLAERTKLCPPDEAFVAGILHDIGKVVLAHYFQELFYKTWEYVKDNQVPWIEAERQALPNNHAEVGGFLADKWQLPEGLIEAVAYHHDFSSDCKRPDLVAIVHAADVLANNCIRCTLDTASLDGIHPEARALVGEPLEKYKEWIAVATEEIDDAAKFFVVGSGR